MSKPLDLVGKRFGSLVVIERRGSDEKGQSMWLVHCDCGTEKVVRGHDLKGGVKSCGCSRRYNTGLYKHGLSQTRLHGIWRSMKDRCYNERSQDYKFYGARGIKLCDEWKEDFIPFYEWSNDNGYKDGLTIDRIDVNGNYCPGNCRWVSMTVQANNRQTNKVFTHNGKTMTVAEWARETGIKYGDIQNRLNYGYSFEEAIDPSFKRVYTFKNAENKKIHDLCAERGMPYSLVIQRVKYGWDIEKALSTPSRRKKNTAAEA